MRKGELTRLIVIVAVAVGAVLLVQGLSKGGAGSKSHSSTSGVGDAGASASVGGPSADPGSAGKAGTSSAPVAVAGGAAVANSLRHGVMTVVMDEPPPGEFAEQNASIQRGAQVAIGELNAAGGLPGHIRINLVSENLNGLPSTALQGRLHAQAAAALILPCDAESQLSVAREAARFGQLMLAPCNPDPTAGHRYPTYWPLGTAANEEAEGLVSFLHTVGYQHMFVLTVPSSQNAELVTGYFRSAAQARGLDVAGNAPVSATTTAYSQLAKTIAATQPKPGAIFTPLPPPYVDRLAAGLRSAGVSQVIIGTSALDTPLTVSGSHGALEGATFPSYGFAREDASGHRFEAEYARRFGRSPLGSFPGLGLETIRLIEAAAHQAHSAEPSAIQRTLAAGLTLHGVALADRSYRRNGDHNPVGVVSISKVSSNTLLPLLAAMPNGEPAR